ncbi:MAG: hypothetical protein PUH96_04170, partial [Coriobacteriaceae bacterium]|nr:hypothetical protein [Coriobacteriaceae bacterium]
LPFSRGLPFTSKTFIVRPLSRIKTYFGRIIGMREGNAWPMGQNVMWTTHFGVREVAEESAARPGGSATTREPAKNRARLHFNSSR